MSLGADVGAALPFFRGQAESLMDSRGTVSRATGARSTDPVTLEESDVFEVVYDGPCKLKSGATLVGLAEIPGVVAVTQNAVLSLPFDYEGAADLRVNDVWECTENFYNPALVGRKVRVTGVHSQTYATAHRYPVTEVT